MKPFRRMTLGTQLLLIGVASTLAFTIAFVGISYAVESGKIDRELRAACATAADRLAGMLTVTLWNYDIPSIQSELMAEAQSADLLSAQVLNEAGTVMAWVVRSESGEISSGLEGSLVPPGLPRPFFQVNRPVVSHERTIGSCTVWVTDNARIVDFTERMVSTLWTLLLYTTLCISVLLLGVRRLIVQRIIQLSRVMADFSGSGFASRIPAERHDEIGDLGRAFNQMAQTISAYSTNMEGLVKEKTSQLVEAEKLAFLGSMVAGFSHEINTPLGNAIVSISYQEQCLADTRAKLEQGTLSRHDLDSLISDLGSVSALVSANLDKTVRLFQSLKSMGLDQTEGQRTLIDLDRFVADHVTLLRDHLAGAGITLHSDIPPDLRLICHANLLGQVLTILIMNVVTHAYPKGATGSIDLAARTAGNLVTLEFRDHGRGLAPEYLRRVFTPFFTTLNHEGHVGLGLYIAWTAVKKMDGSLSCSNHPAGGLAFQIRLPLGLPVTGQA